jgi:hypothetical protein
MTTFATCARCADEIVYLRWREADGEDVVEREGWFHAGRGRGVSAIRGCRAASRLGGIPDEDRPRYWLAAPAVNTERTWPRTLQGKRLAASFDPVTV